MKAHEYWSVGALITASSLLCMIMAIYTGHRIISKNKKTEKESNSIENEE